MVEKNVFTTHHGVGENSSILNIDKDKPNSQLKFLFDV